MNKSVLETALIKHFQKLEVEMSKKIEEQFGQLGKAIYDILRTPECYKEWGFTDEEALARKLNIEQKIKILNKRM